MLGERRLKVQLVPQGAYFTVLIVLTFADIQKMWLKMHPYSCIGLFSKRKLGCSNLELDDDKRPRLLLNHVT